MKTVKLAGASLLLSALVSGPFSATVAEADENLWIYTKGTDTRPEGSWELKMSDIARIGKNSGSYEFHDIRPEIEYGITDRLTLGVETMIFHHDYNDVEWAPMVDTQGGPGGSFKDTQLAGVEVTTKYNVLSPYKDWFGLSFGFSWEYRDAYRLDGAAIDQHSFGSSDLPSEELPRRHPAVGVRG